MEDTAVMKPKLPCHKWHELGKDPHHKDVLTDVLEINRKLVLVMDERMCGEEIPLSRTEEISCWITALGLV